MGSRIRSAVLISSGVFCQPFSSDSRGVFRDRCLFSGRLPILRRILRSRRANAFVFTAFSHICALALMVAVAIVIGGVFPDRASIAWAVLAGALGGFSLAIFYGALAAGQMGLTAPIAALLGAAIPTMVDIALEGAPSRWSIAGFALAISPSGLSLVPRPKEKTTGPTVRKESRPRLWLGWDSPAFISAYTRPAVRPRGLRRCPASVR